MNGWKWPRNNGAKLGYVWIGFETFKSQSGTKEGKSMKCLEGMILIFEQVYISVFKVYEYMKVIWDH